MITGRSDATLNRGGVRLGTGEFYSVVEGLDEVVDSVVVHLEDAEGGAGRAAAVRGARRRPASSTTRCARQIAPRAAHRAVAPARARTRSTRCRAVPRTLSGKKLEVPVKRILTGTPVDSAAAKGALANPESLTAFDAFAQRRATPRRPTAPDGGRAAVGQA